MRILVVVALAAWALPAAAAIVPAWLSSLPAVPMGLRVVFLAVVLAVFVVQTLRLTRSVLAYGHAETRDIGNFVRQAIGLAIVLAALAIPMLLQRFG
jgi:hypothetical protein